MRYLAQHSLRYWFAWLLLFYGVWLFLIVQGDNLTLALEHGSMALAMALGSYAAGSTPMGGGTIGFPVLVLLFDMPASLGRDFSFAVQSIGMVSASIFIFCRRQPLAWSMLRGALLGALLTTPMGILWFAPLVPELWVKLSFAVLWGSFGVFHLYRLGEITDCEYSGDPQCPTDFRVGLLLGAFAGFCVVAVTGVGVDMLVYAALVLLSRVDLKVAIPTSVVVMAFCSVLGVGVKSLTGDWQPDVFGNWLAAAPVVALGAPLGVFAVSLLGRKPTLLIVAFLCVVQLLWTCISVGEALQGYGGYLVLLALLCCLAGFEGLRALGLRRERGDRSSGDTRGSEGESKSTEVDAVLVQTAE
ncbi:sulfite exporter TauE/SafE family protein [Microbulbifer sp. OS29]|uniref:Probable membrane transporter protein n=1 Tax=Microbulbifer okhotskensis TaxID=2926617 RepID=A0A9X2EQI0_9GAMM|nr:sulfite exporter TauE/SafE family protein [Microbulbifer okhotskensis]MCO1333756.1 sulfite exporter TauE/SafE family protein [Microbulbifer okhotskensis]